MLGCNYFVTLWSCSDVENGGAKPISNRNRSDYIFAFLVLAAFSFQLYDPALRPRFWLFGCILVGALALSKYRLAMIASGFAYLAFRCVIGLFIQPGYAFQFGLIALTSACIAWFALRASAERSR
jgi:hypothetical protein